MVFVYAIYTYVLKTSISAIHSCFPPIIFVIDLTDADGGGISSYSTSRLLKYLYL